MTIMRNPDPRLNYALQHARFWQRVMDAPGGEARYWAMLVDTNTAFSYTEIPVEQVFLEHELQAYEPRLVHLLRECAQGSLADRVRFDAGQYGSDVLHSLQLWSGQHYCFPKEAFVHEFAGESYQHKVFSHILQIVPDHPLGIWLSVNHFRLHAMQSGELYCQGVIPGEITLKRCWLDAHYPDWEQRLLTAKTLGLGSDDAAMYAMPTRQRITQHTPVALPEDLIAGSADMPAITTGQQ